jgi:hypothetical protein
MGVWAVTEPACKSKILQPLRVGRYLIGNVMVNDREERRPVLVLHGHPGYIHNGNTIKLTAPWEQINL